MSNRQLPRSSLVVALAGTVALLAISHLFAGESILLSPADGLEACALKAAQVTPSARQVAWQRLEFTGFLHFGMNTFTDRDWGQGDEDPRVFNPRELDCRQWVAAAKAAGLTELILTAKHHDGFCLWPSRFTEHCVRNSPWKNGHGDVVREFCEACREAGMRFGIYISPWDRHEPAYGDSPRYNEHFLNQLREVLTNYPGISEVWFDGACGEGPNGKKQDYDWRGYWSLVRKLAPQAVISSRGPDVRWCGNEAGHSRANEWSIVPLTEADAGDWATSDATLRAYARDIYGDDLGSRQALYNARSQKARLVWYPAQVDTPIRPDWFYHQSQDNQVKSLEELVEIYFGAVGGNAQLLLNIGPDRRGLIHENDVARLRQLGEFLRQTFATNLASGAKITADVSSGHSVGAPATVLDGDLDTFWTTNENPQTASLTFELGAPRRFNCAMLQEHLPSGQRVEEFGLEIRAGGSWQDIARSTVIGQKRLLRFDPVVTDAVRLKFLAFRGRPTLAEFGLFETPALLAAPKIKRDLDGVVTIQHAIGAQVRYTLDGSDPTAASPLYGKPIPLHDGGILSARAFPPPGGTSLNFAGDAVTQVELGLAKRNWKLVEVDSEEPADGAGRLAFDEDPATFWHSKFRGGEEPLPHHLTVDLGEVVSITGFTYLPRQDRWDGGIVRRARFEVSLDGKDWNSVVQAARFDNILNSRSLQVVRLKNPASARFFRFTALESVGNNRLASAAELSVLVKH